MLNIVWIRNRNRSGTGAGAGTKTFPKSEPEPQQSLRFHNTVVRVLLRSAIKPTLDGGKEGIPTKNSIFKLVMGEKGGPGTAIAAAVPKKKGSTPTKSREIWKT